MRIAVPVANGSLAMHFGHCEHFAIMECDEQAKTVNESRLVPAPAHQPGLLPRWLSEHGVDVVIAGGMGMRAKDLFCRAGIQVVTGAPAEAPETIAERYLSDSLEVGENACDH